ncbi:MAG: sensor histidine kinase [Chitinophagaceae bacterium]
MTNSIKYGFPPGRQGIITISLKHVTEDNYQLSIADNGIGLPEGFETRKKSSLGMNLMEGLSEDMNGHFVIKDSSGTTINITFTYPNPETVQQTTNETAGI